MVMAKSIQATRFLFSLLALCMLLSVFVPAPILFAAETTAAEAAASPTDVSVLMDDENILSAADKISLTAQAKALAEQYKMDVLMAITSKDTGLSANENANKILDAAPYEDVVLCLIDLHNQTIWLTARGAVNRFLTNEDAGQIAQAMIDENDLTQGAYAGAFGTYLARIRQALLNYQLAASSSSAATETALAETEEASTPQATTMPEPTPEPTLARDLLPKKNNTTAEIANTPSGAPALLDAENFLSAEQQTRLSKKALDLGNKYGLDVVFVIMSIDTGQSAKQNAEDLFDYGGYAQDGILGLIDIANRTVWVSTTRKGKGLISDPTPTKIAEKVVARNSLKEGEYAGAMKTLVELVDDKLADTRPRIKLMDVLVALGVATLSFLIFFGSTSVIYRKPVGAKRVINMKTQAIPNYEVIEDNLVNTYTRSERIASSSSGGSGGGGGGGFSGGGGGGCSHGGGGASW